MQIYHINKLKKKNHTIISIDQEKAIWQKPTPTYDENSKVWIDWKLSNLMKNIDKKTYS